MTYAKRPMSQRIAAWVALHGTAPPPTSGPVRGYDRKYEREITREQVIVELAAALAMMNEQPLVEEECCAS